MTWAVRIDLMCDEGTCSEVEVFHEDTVTAARSEARKEGWRTVAGGRDLCPEHAAERTHANRRRGAKKARQTRAAATLLDGLFVEGRDR